MILVFEHTQATKYTIGKLQAELQAKIDGKEVINEVAYMMKVVRPSWKAVFEADLSKDQMMMMKLRGYKGWKLVFID